VPSRLRLNLCNLCNQVRKERLERDNKQVRDGVLSQRKHSKKLPVRAVIQDHPMPCNTASSLNADDRGGSSFARRMQRTQAEAG
jgi:hypothetical protein